MDTMTVLMVEDETDVALINKQYLENKGYNVVIAENMAAGRSLFKSCRPDLVLLDVMLPDGPGYELGREVRAAGAVPVIYLTCRDENESVVRGLMEGGDDYITKPYDLDVMGARIAAVLRRGGRQTAAQVALPPLELNMITGQAVLGGQPLGLSKKEMQLLAFFAVNPGRTFTSGELYEQIWGDPALDASPTVKVHISTLRKKLGTGQPGCPFEIRGTRGGYAFNKIHYSAGDDA